MGIEPEQYLPRIEFGVRPTSINHFDLGVEYLVTQEWIERVRTVCNEEVVEVSTSASDLTITLIIRNLPEHQTATLIALKTWRMDRLQYENLPLDKWSADRLLVNFQNANLGKGRWKDNCLVIGDMFLWFASRFELEELLVFSSLSDSGREIVDDKLIEDILSSTHMTRISKAAP